MITIAPVRRAGLFAALVACVLMPEAIAYQQHINVTRTAAVAKGSNSVVVQVETSGSSKGGKASSRRYAPDLNHSEFKKVDIRVDPAAQTSDHSHTVAKLFFGQKRSITKGIDKAYIYHSNTWLRRLSAWDLSSSNVSMLFPGPVVNHSWVSSQKNSASYLRRADYSALSNNILHVAGVRRGGAGTNMMAGGYNSLVVGGAVKNIETPYPMADEFYADGRTRPHLVGPYPHASAAAPVVAAAAVRLNALAAKRKLLFPTISRAGSEQLPVELVKAILMASASGDFNYPTKKETHVNSFGTVGLTPNGLDKRYGMGMLNVDAAEELLESPSNSKPSTGTGFDFRTGFKGTSGNTVCYTIQPKRSGELTVSLAWLADLHPVEGRLEGQVYDFDLELVDVTSDAESQNTQKQVATSASLFDTTENIRVNVERGRTYEIKVSRKPGADQALSDKPWDFALAWNLAN